MKCRHCLKHTAGLPGQPDLLKESLIKEKAVQVNGYPRVMGGMGILAVAAAQTQQGEALDGALQHKGMLRVGCAGG